MLSKVIYIIIEYHGQRGLREFQFHTSVTNLKKEHYRSSGILRNRINKNLISLYI